MDSGQMGGEKDGGRRFQRVAWKRVTGKMASLKDRLASFTRTVTCVGVLSVKGRDAAIVSTRTMRLAPS